ncbi:MAG: nucleotidyltransferase family protein [Candidatus Woesearchaeota archaeon]
MKGIILAGGYATRLHPLTENQPKHLLPIQGKPMIEYLFEKLQTLPIDEYYLVTNAKFATHFQKWAEQSQWADDIIIVNDQTTSNDDRLGSIGDILYAIDTYNIIDDFFIIGADNITDFDFQQLYDEFEQKKKPIVGAYDVGDLSQVSQFGQITIDDSSKITSFVEKPENPSSTLISTLFYMIPHTSLPIIRSLVEEGNSDKAGFLIKRLIDETDVYSVVHKGYWFDIGTPQMYKQTQDFFEKKGKL